MVSVSDDHVVYTTFSDNNIRAAHWADHQWNAEWADNPTRPRIFIPDTSTPWTELQSELTDFNKVYPILKVESTSHSSTSHSSKKLHYTEPADTAWHQVAAKHITEWYCFKGRGEPTRKARTSTKRHKQCLRVSVATLQHFHPRHQHPPPRNDPPKNSLCPAQPPPQRCRAFALLLVQRGMASSAACKCGSEQTANHVVLQCPIHRPPHGLHNLTVLDDETIEWLLNTCPEIWCVHAVLELAQKWRSVSN